MGKKVLRSHISILAPFEEDFVDQKLLDYEETCSFNNYDIRSLKANGDFSTSTIFKPFDALFQPNVISPTWVCFPQFPFSFGLTYPFSGFISKFFDVT